MTLTATTITREATTEAETKPSEAATKTTEATTIRTTSRKAASRNNSNISHDLTSAFVGVESTVDGCLVSRISDSPAFSLHCTFP